MKKLYFIYGTTNGEETKGYACTKADARKIAKARLNKGQTNVHITTNYGMLVETF